MPPKKLNDMDTVQDCVVLKIIDKAIEKDAKLKCYFGNYLHYPAELISAFQRDEVRKSLSDILDLQNERL